MSKVAACMGKEGDATPFTEVTVENISKTLHKCVAPSPTTLHTKGLGDSCPGSPAAKHAHTGGPRLPGCPSAVWHGLVSSPGLCPEWP